MRGKRKMLKRRNRIYRRIAVALTVALLAGQSQALVLAEEGDAPQTEISSEETGANISDSGNDTGGGSTDGGDGDVQNTEEGKTPEDNKNDGEEQDKCICGTKCAEDAINTNCPVCAKNAAVCAGQTDDAENNDSENDGQENIDGNTEGTTNGQECICETACTEDSVNADCPVCVESYVNCAKNVGGGVNPSVEMAVLANAAIEEAGIATLAEDGADPLVTERVFTEGDITYELTADNKAEVITYEKSESDTVTIPETVKGYPVTRITNRAFLGCQSLTDVTIPASVEFIDSGAFIGCSSLESVTMLGGVASIRYSTFMDCRSLKSVAIPTSVTKIEEHAFANCKSLESITIPASVKMIEWAAFANCESLKSITIPADMTSIEMSTFHNCSSLKSVTILGSVTKIGERAFAECESLESVTIPASVKTIEKSAFSQCGLLEKQVYIRVLSDGKPQFPEVEDGAFDGPPFPKDRKDIIFVDENGDELTEEALNEADVKTAFKQAAANDGDSDNTTWHGWPYTKAWEETAEKLHITATATAGGTIDPEGDSEVAKSAEITFTITPDEGNKIKTVTVDAGTAAEKDVTAELADTLARAQTGARYYTFTNVTEDHTIHAAFEKDGNGSGGGGDNPNPNPNPNPGGGSSGDNTGDNGSSGGGDTNSGNGSGAVNAVNSDSGNSAGNGQAAFSAGNVSAQAQAQSGGNGTSAGGKEPKTGDASYLEVYATLAMIAGLTYLILYMLEESRGMSEREKETFIAAFIRWGKKGGAFRKGCAVAAIFCLLAYYHTIGKRAWENALRENYMGQAV